jgi:hypothetical protein
MKRRQTAWKKSRTFGDVFGGRAKRKITDGVFRRAHSLNPPGPHDSPPIFIIDNPSRDFFFPLEREEIIEGLALLPRCDWCTITHIWQRRFRKADYEAAELPLAEFICGSGVRLIVLYPWPKNLSMPLGWKKPTRGTLKTFADYTTDLRRSGTSWYLQWTLEDAKRFCAERLLYREIGYHLDWYTRRWSKANCKAVDESAKQYAYERTTLRTGCRRDTIGRAAR